MLLQLSCVVSLDPNDLSADVEFLDSQQIY